MPQTEEDLGTSGVRPHPRTPQSTGLTPHQLHEDPSLLYNNNNNNSLFFHFVVHDSRCLEYLSKFFDTKERELGHKTMSVPLGDCPVPKLIFR